MKLQAQYPVNRWISCCFQILKFIGFLCIMIRDSRNSCLVFIKPVWISTKNSSPLRPLHRVMFDVYAYRKRIHSLVNFWYRAKFNWKRLIGRQIFDFRLFAINFSILFEWERNINMKLCDSIYGIISFTSPSLSPLLTLNLHRTCFFLENTLQAFAWKLSFQIWISTYT